MHSANQGNESAKNNQSLRAGIAFFAPVISALAIGIFFSNYVVPLSYLNAQIIQVTPKSEGKLIEENYDVITIRDASGKDQKVGYVHYEVRELQGNEKGLIRAKKTLKMRVQRGKDTSEIDEEYSTDENAKNEVVGIFIRQKLGTNQFSIRRGKLNGSRMEFTSEGLGEKSDAPWDKSILGVRGENNFFKNKKYQSGDSFDYMVFIHSLTYPNKVHLQIDKLEQVQLLGKSKTLRKITLIPYKIKAQTTDKKPFEIQLPSSTSWIDPKTNEILLTETDFPGMGLIRIQRGSIKDAMAPNGKLPELISNQSIRVSKVIANIETANAIKYRISVKTPLSDIKKMVAEDARQSIEESGRNQITLEVEAIRDPKSVSAPKKVGEEYLQSNYFINSDDPKVQKFAKLAIGLEIDPWRKAQRIEKWVHDHMQTSSYTEALATADHVAKTLTGDCTEYAMLAAAMCRAVKIPSRTAIGLIYVNDRKIGPMMAFHMWTEVFVNNQWLALDATRGFGSVGPDHLKITDHHWHKIRTFDPLLPVTNFILSKPTIDIITVRQPN